MLSVIREERFRKKKNRKEEKYNQRPKHRESLLEEGCQENVGCTHWDLLRPIEEWGQERISLGSL